MPKNYLCHCEVVSSEIEKYKERINAIKMKYYKKNQGELFEE